MTTQGIDWQADWIWCRGEAAPYHLHLFARRTLEIDQPAAAVLHITATDRYRLFVNGRYLGRGPARCDYRRQSYDTYDVSALLRSGLNAIAVQAYYYGCSTGYTRDARAGLLAQLEITHRDGRTETIGTDARWRVRPAQGWRRDARPVDNGVGVTEIYDASLDPADWPAPEYDDRAWEPAEVIGTTLWSRPEPRDIPMLAEQEVYPAAVLKLGEAMEMGWETLSDAGVPEILAQEIHEPLQHARVENAAAVLCGDESVATVATSRAGGADIRHGFRDPFILLDMGRQVNGFPRIRLEGQAGGIVDLTYGEELVGGRIAPLTMGMRLGDRYVMRDGPQTWEAFEYKSFRYLQVSFRNLEQPVRVRSISVNTYTYPATPRGRFACADATLTRLWQACADTTHLCMDDGFMDSPLREKRNWLGDGSHALLGTYAAFGDVALVRRYFRLAAQGAEHDGMLRMFFPGNDFTVGGTKATNFIPQHALVWAVRVWEHYELFGDRAFLEEMHPTLVGLAGWCQRHAGRQGLLDRLPYWNWLDWTSTDLRGAHFATNAFYLKLLDDLAATARTLGQAAEAGRWHEEAGRVRAALQGLFWNESKGRFEDSLLQGALTGIASELGNSLALLYGIADPEQAGRIAAHLAETSSDLAPVTPLFFHYVFQGLCRAGRADLALELTRRRYGPMMAESATMWESFTPHAGMVPPVKMPFEVVAEQAARGVTGPWRGMFGVTFSRAHCGSVPMALLLTTEILGIRPLEPGFGRCLLQPRVDLLAEAAGAFPSARGEIAVSWAKGVVEVRLPEGVEAELRLPGREMALGEGVNRIRPD